MTTPEATDASTSTSTLPNAISAFSTLQKEPPDVAFDRLCKVHQGSGFQQECQVCQRFFPNWYKLKQHLHTHADYRPYACTYCDKTFRNYSKKSRHEKIHSGLKPYSCKICNKHVSRSEHLKRHLLTHTESHPFKCIHCEYRSRRLDCIRYHMKNKHPEQDHPKIMFNQQMVDADGDYPNDASDILWQQYKESNLDVLSLTFTNIKPQSQSTGTKSKKKKKKKAPENTASCPFPDGKMPTYPVATSQMITPHLNTPQFQASTIPPTMIPGFPGFAASLNQVKQEPMQPQQQGQPQQQQQQQQQQSGDLHGINTKNQLMAQNHSKSPTNGQKPIDSNFSDNEGVSNLNKYYMSSAAIPRTNDLELPRNMCGICEKAFDCPSKLQRHQNTHAGIRPYKCEVCGKQLSRPEHLKRHLMTHDPDRHNKSPAYKKSKANKQQQQQQQQTQQQQQQPSPSSAIELDLTAASQAALKASNQAHDVKQEVDGHSNQMPCQLQKPPPSTSADVSTNASQPQQQHQHQQITVAPTVVNTAASSSAAAAAVVMASWSQAPSPMLNPVLGSMRGDLAHPQMVTAATTGPAGLTSYSPHVAMLHTYAFGAPAAAAAMGQPPNLYSRATPNPALAAQNVMMAAPNCNMPVFPPITDMR